MNCLRISDEKVKATTKKMWQEWFRILDRRNAKRSGHYATAKHLAAKYRLSPWWAQVVTIRYENERGYWRGASREAGKRRS